MSNYSDVKNYIHNELGITKEYIDEVIKKTVQDEISKLMNDDCFIRGLIENEVARSLYKKDNNRWHTIYDASNYIEDKITKTILNTVKEKLVIGLKDDNEYEGNYDVKDFNIVKDNVSGHYGVQRKDDD